MTRDQSTEEKILAAAKEVFQQKGMAGARMQEIADKVGINKAMLHYYFRSKDQLFAAVFNEARNLLLPRINEIMNSDLPLFEKIEQFVSNYITVISQYPMIPGFVLNELSQNPEKFAQQFFTGNKPNPAKFVMQVQEEIAAGRIKPINPVQLMVNIISLSIFPFIGRPMLKNVLGMSDEFYWEFIEARKKEVPRFVIDAIKI